MAQLLHVDPHAVFTSLLCNLTSDQNLHWDISDGLSEEVWILGKSSSSLVTKAVTTGLQQSRGFMPNPCMFYLI